MSAISAVTSSSQAAAPTTFWTGAHFVDPLADHDLSVLRYSSAQR